MDFVGVFCLLGIVTGFFLSICWLNGCLTFVLIRIFQFCFLFQLVFYDDRCSYFFYFFVTAFKREQSKRQKGFFCSHKSLLSTVNNDQIRLAVIPSQCDRVKLKSKSNNVCLFSIKTLHMQ